MTSLVLYISGTVSTVAGGGGGVRLGHADGVGTIVRFHHPSGVAVTSAGDVIVSDTENNIIRKIITTGYRN